MANTKKAAETVEKENELQEQPARQDSEESIEDIKWTQAQRNESGLSLVPKKKVERNQTVEPVLVKGKPIVRKVGDVEMQVVRAK